MDKVDPPPPYTPYQMAGVHYPPPQQGVVYPPQPPQGYPQQPGTFHPVPPMMPQQQQPINPNYIPNYGTTTVIVPPEVIVVGACPACRIGILEDDYSCLGIMCAIVFFPIGLLCCLAMKNKRCSNCGAEF